MAGAVGRLLFFAMTAAAILSMYRHKVAATEADTIARQLRTARVQLSVSERGAGELKKQLQQGVQREKDLIGKMEGMEDKIMRLTDEKQEMTTQQATVKTHVQAIKLQLEMAEKEIMTRKEQLRTFSDLAHKRSAEAQSAAQKLSHVQESLDACTRMLDSCDNSLAEKKDLLEKAGGDLALERAAVAQQLRVVHESEEELEGLERKVKKLEEQVGSCNQMVQKLEATAGDSNWSARDRTPEGNGDIRSSAGGARDWGVRGFMRGIGVRGGSETLLRNLKSMQEDIKAEE